MPVITTFKTDNAISSGVSGTSVSQAGEQAMAQALSSVGSGIANVGKAIEFQEEQTAKTAANTSSMDSKSQIANLKTALDEKYRGTDGVGKEKEFNEGMDKIVKSHIKQLPDRASGKYQEKITPFLDGESLRMSVSSREQGYDFRKTKYAEAEVTALDSVNKNPSPENAGQVYMDLFESYEDAKSGALAPEVASAFQSSVGKRVRDNLMAGLEAKGDAVSASQMKDLLKSDTPYMQGMKGAEVRKYNRRAESILKKKKQESDISTLFKTENTLRGLQNNQDVDTRSLKNEINNSGFNDIKKKKLLSQVQVAEVSRKVVNDSALNNYTQEEIKAIVKDEIELGGGILEAGTEAETERRILSKVAQNNKARMKDPVGHFNRHDESIKNKGLAAMKFDPENPEKSRQHYLEYKSAMDARYDEFNTPKGNRKYATAEMKSKFGGQLKNAISKGDGISFSQAANELEAMSGDDAYKMYQEMDLDRSTSAISEFGMNAKDKSGLMQIVENTKPETKERIESTYKGIKGARNTNRIKAYLRDSDVYSSFEVQNGATANNLNNMDAMLEHASLEYKRLVGSGIKEEEAKEQSLGLITKGYNKVRGNNSRNIYVPEKYNNSGAVEDFLEKENPRGNFNLNFSMVDRYNIDVGNSSKESWDQARFEWIPTADKEGLQLYHNRNGALSPVPQKDSNSPIYKSFAEINERDYTPPQQEPLVSGKKARELNKARTRDIFGIK